LAFEDQGALDNERAAITYVVKESITKVNNAMLIDNLTDRNRTGAYVGS